MTNQEYPFIPPYELVQEWGHDANLAGVPYKDDAGDWLYEQHIATRAAQWGADQELEACCEWLAKPEVALTGKGPSDLRAARRPKPLSLKEQALAELAEWENVMDIASDSPIRRALEQLPE